MRIHCWFGAVIAACGLAVIYWAVFAGPWVTKFVWDDEGQEHIAYFRGDVSTEQLVKEDLYQAVHMKLKSRSVIRPPDLKQRGPEHVVRDLR